MTRRAILLLAVAAVLAGLLAWQYMPAALSQPGVVPAARLDPAAATPVDGEAFNPLAARDAAALADLAAHPLFSPSRQPPAPVAPPAVAAPAPQPAMPQVTAPVQAAPVLQGLVLTPAPGGAYVADGRGGESIFLRPGQSALGLTLEAVAPNSATFMGPAGEVVLRMPDATDPPPTGQPKP